MITIYTDGAARGNPGPGGWGAIVFYDDVVRELGDKEVYTTNNRMELTAAIKALELVKDLEDVTVHTDSEYVAKGMTEWISNWQKNNWRTAARKPVINQDLWQKLIEVSAGKRTKWVYVAGHSGDKYNDRCDEIATRFADNLPPDLYHGPKAKYDK